MSKLYIGNLSFEVTDEGLQQLFTSNGFQVESARVIRDMNTGRSRGFGFVELPAGEDMARAITQLNGSNLEGRAIQVNEARPQAPRGGSRGGGRDHRGGGGGRGRGRF
jgi:RNA recognition motif-containing protein